MHRGGYLLYGGEGRRGPPGACRLALWLISAVFLFFLVGVVATVVSFVLFLWQLHVWNLLGWRF